MALSNLKLYVNGVPLFGACERSQMVRHMCLTCTELGPEQIDSHCASVKYSPVSRKGLVSINGMFLSGGGTLIHFLARAIEVITYLVVTAEEFS